MSTENDYNQAENFQPTEFPQPQMPPPGSPQGGPPQMFWGMAENTYCMLMHLSLFAGAAVPGAGLVLPIVMWVVNKDQSPVIDANGKNILNFMISIFIYAFVSGILSLMIIGLIPLFAVIIAAIVCPIIAAVKANNGEYWPYPLCIRFFK